MAGNYDASANWLRLADTKTPGAEMAIGITQAQLQLSSNHLEQALATLQSLHKKFPRHAHILKLLKQVYTRLNDWQSLEQLLPKLRKQKVISEDEYHQLETKAFQELFAKAYQYGRHRIALEDRIKSAREIWSKLSQNQKKDPAILLRYAECLVRLGADSKVEKVLRASLNNCFSDQLIRIYGKVSGNDFQKTAAVCGIAAQINAPIIRSCCWLLVA